MSEPKHTAGPWQWVCANSDKPIDYTVACERVIKEAQDTHIIGCLSLRTVKEYPAVFSNSTLPKFILDHDGEMTKADMQLIAAAPDLLEALNSFMHAVALAPEDQIAEKIQEAFRKGRAAIAKAQPEGGK